MKPYILNSSKRVSLTYKFNLNEPPFGKLCIYNHFDYKTLKRMRKEQRRSLQLEKKKARRLLKNEIRHLIQNNDE